MKKLWIIIIVVIVAGGGYAVTRFTAPSPSPPVLVTSPTVPSRIEANMPTDATAGAVAPNSSASPASPAASSEVAKMGAGQFSGPQWDTGANMRERAQQALSAEYQRQKASSGQPAQSDSRILKPVGVQ
jgi:hypothetical protein